MPITYYDTVNGQLVGETTSGVRTEYLTDALGSVTATMNSSGEIVNTYRYKPYGQLLSKTGTGEDPRYLWSGNTGSRRTLVTYAEQYNQARHYGSKQAGWTTVDLLWPIELAYGYVSGRPTSYVDKYGTDVYPVGSGCDGPVDKTRRLCEQLGKCLLNEACRTDLVKCIGAVNPPDFLSSILEKLRDICLDDSHKICVGCPDSKSPLPNACKKACSGNYAITVSPIADPIPFPSTDPTSGTQPILPIRPCKDTPYAYVPCELELKLGNPSLKTCSCIVLLCDPKPPSTTIAHEMLHCAGLAGEGPGHGKGRDIVYKIERCLGRMKIK